MSVPTPPWPGPDEGRVIAEMLADPTSLHWDYCYVCVDAIARSPAMRRRFSILNDDDVAGKMADITMQRVRAGLASFRQDCHLRTFLAAILTHEVLSYLRTRRLATTSLTPSAAEHPLAEPLAPDDVEYLVELRDLLRRVLDAIHRYVASRKNPSRAARILDLWLDGISAQAIAERLGVSYQTVMNTIHRLRRVLRRLLAD